MNPAPLTNCFVVLVRPRIAANIGAVARTMRNMGLDQLILVSPHAQPLDPRALRLATHSEEILKNAVIVEHLPEAIAQCGVVAATSARPGGLFRRQSVGTPRQIIPILGEISRSSPVALVFGPESTGLTNEEISLCHYLLHIPSNPEHQALNLAQAVTVCLYELRLFFSENEVSQSPLPDPLASHAAQEIMFAKLRMALERIHFLYGAKADSLMHALRHLLGRAHLTAMEVDLLFGLARQIQWYCDHHENPGHE